MKNRLLRFSVFALLITLSGCASNAQNFAPAAPDSPWVPRGDENTTLWSMATTPAPVPTHTGFAIPADPSLAVLPAVPEFDANLRYSLPQLIDIAQQNNSSTRVAWQHARQAALAVGMVEATYLPMLSASVVAGYQDLNSQLPEVLGYTPNVDTRLSGAAPILSLQWLLFDFGQREALAEAARHMARAANVLFNGAHQQVIFAVSEAYYLYAASIERQKRVQQALNNALAIEKAVLARRKQGLATVMETAQARQAVAQAQFRAVQLEGQVRDAYQVLLAAIGVQARLNIDVASVMERPLPAPAAAPIDAMIAQALAQRPDIAASYAALQASQAGIAAVRAGYLPKVFLAGNVALGSSSFDVARLPSLDQQQSGTGVVVGVTMPLFDGGLRDARLKEAESRTQAAQDDFQRIQTAALTEIILARNGLTSAFESNRAATALVAASQTTYDAALDAYRHGVGTVDVAQAADNALIAAHEAQIDARTAARVQAVKLAFALGALSSVQNLPR